MVLDNLNTVPIGQQMTKTQKQAVLAALISWETFTDAMQTVIAPILLGLLVETAEDAMPQAGKQPSQFDATDEAVIAYNAARTLKIATDVNAETEKQLRASLGQGFDADESLGQLQARVENVFGAGLTYRSDRITQTESTRAQGAGDEFVWQQARNVTAKEWYTVLDERTCPFCASLNGLEVSLRSNYFGKGDTVEADGKSMAVSHDDIPHPPLHANCRYRLLPVLA